MVEWPAAGLGTMYKLIDSLPEQLALSADLAGLDQVKPARPGTRRLVLCGMGGSAIAGDLIQPLLHAGKVSLTVWRDYGLPHWVDADDLVLCCSYSGNTEESLSGAKLAGEIGCQRVAITSGGELAEMAAKDQFPRVGLPGGLPPRASLGYGLGALLRVLDGLGVCAESGAQIDAAIKMLRQNNADCQASMHGDAAPEKDAEGNISPGALAEKWVGRMPIIYTAGHEAHAVGVRLKAQINENSKMPALVVPFPELDHNDLVGWCLSPEQKQRFVLLILRGEDDNDRIKKRVEVTRELLQSQFDAIDEIRSKGNSPLERVLSLVQYGGYLSCHLARLNEVDPVPVDRITKLKNALG